jgi:hypothetical protein
MCIFTAISMVGFSVCISSRNLIIVNFSRCVRSLLSETHLLQWRKRLYIKMTDIQLTFYVANLITIK